MEKVHLACNQLHPRCPTQFSLNGKKYKNLRIPYNPLFELCDSIELKKDEHMDQLLHILSGEEEVVNLNEVEAIKKLAKQHFGVELQVDKSDLSRTLVTLLAKDNIDTHVLDSLRTDTICEALEAAYEKGNVHDKVETNVDKYLKETKKRDYDKEKIKTSKTYGKPRYREKREEPNEERTKETDQPRRDRKGSEKKVHYREKREADQTEKANDRFSFNDYRKQRDNSRKEKKSKDPQLDQLDDMAENILEGRTRGKEAGEEPRNFDDRRFFKQTRKERWGDINDKGEKVPRDNRINLGVTGETTVWWRENGRPTSIKIK